MKPHEAFSDLQYEVQNSISSEQTVVSIVTVTGKHTGSFFGSILPTRNKITYEAMHSFTIGENGKIAMHKAIRGDLVLTFSTWAGQGCITSL